MSVIGAGRSVKSTAVVEIPIVISMSSHSSKKNADGTRTHTLLYSVKRGDLPIDYLNEHEREVHVAPSDPVLVEDLEDQAIGLVLRRMNVRWWQFLRRERIVRSAKMKDDFRTGHYFIEITTIDV